MKKTLLWIGVLGFCFVGNSQARDFCRFAGPDGRFKIIDSGSFRVGSHYRTDIGAYSEKLGHNWLMTIVKDNSSIYLVFESEQKPQEKSPFKIKLARNLVITRAIDETATNPKNFSVECRKAENPEDIEWTTDPSVHKVGKFTQENSVAPVRKEEPLKVEEAK